MNIGLEYIEYALTFNLFELHRPLQLGYLVNASANEDNFQLRFTPPGLPDTIVIEGTLDKLRVYLRDPDDPQLFYPGFAYLVKDHVFLFTDTDIDEWFTEQFAEFGCVTDWRHKGMTPCWIPIERFWGTNINSVVIRLFWKPLTSLGIVYYVARNTVASWTHQR